jgi:hypothetical protein
MPPEGRAVSETLSQGVGPKREAIWFVVATIDQLVPALEVENGANRHVISL